MLSFLRPHPASERRQRAIVIGGSMAGLLSARILLDEFEEVVLIERDRIPETPQARPGVPQSLHVHILLTQGQRLLEQLFPGITTELDAAGAVMMDWSADCLLQGIWGWYPLAPSPLTGRACSRILLEWLVRQRLMASDRLTILAGYQVDRLVMNRDRTQVVGVEYHQRTAHAPSTHSTLTADLVVDASGRQSRLPQWLTEYGYEAPQETVIDSFLGYATRWYQVPSNSQAPWRAVILSACPPDHPRAGLVFPIEGDRWIVTLTGIGRDYPPTDEAGFLEYARSLRDPVLYNAIKAATPLSPIYAHRGTQNRLLHYDRLKRLPTGVVALGDAVCAFNPAYGQGMTTAAMGAMLLRDCLQQRSLSQLTLTFQRQLGRLVQGPWLMATGEDARWTTTEGATLSPATRLIQRYFDRVVLQALDDVAIYHTFAAVVHMVQPPTALFHPRIVWSVLTHLNRQPPPEIAPLRSELAGTFAASTVDSVPLAAPHP